MDVVCGRCRAEYEFDDALISERGTTVRCTNCGLQFKVFPPVGQRAPEVWRVFDPTDRTSPVVEYDSLRDLQKGIAQGVVRAEHLLARGEEPPRPLSDIVELKPLLHQPRSDPPPAATRSSEPDEPSEPDESSEPDEPKPETKTVPESAAPIAASGSSTVLGIAQRPNPTGGVGPVNAPAPPHVSRAVPPPLPTQKDSVTAPTPPIPLVADDADSRPRIRSALSVSPLTEPSGAPLSDESDARDTPTGSSLAPPRQSLRSTLMGGPSDAASSLPPVVSRESPIPPPAHVHAKVEPDVVSAPVSAPPMTPTPGALRAYRSQDAQPISSVAGSAVKQRARSGTLVLSVVVGALAFLGFASRDKISSYLSRTPQAESEKDERREISSDLIRRIELADAAWISNTLLESEEGAFQGEPKEVDLATLERELEETGEMPSWHAVNLKRVQGDLAGARSLAAGLPQGTEQAYALALLDLAESGEDPPWPVILERLKEASTGERGQFLARSVYIYALSASGEEARARADFDAFAKLAGAESAPLFQELRAFLDRRAENGSGSEDTPVELADLEPVADSDVADSDTVAPDAREAQEKVVPEENAVQPKPKEAQPKDTVEATKQDQKPKSSAVSDAIKAKVAEADAMWRGGNQSGAVVIYKQVVAEIGTGHFLGQRSAARIRQAELEAGAQ